MCVDVLVGLGDSLLYVVLCVVCCVLCVVCCVLYVVCCMLYVVVMVCCSADIH